MRQGCCWIKEVPQSLPATWLTLVRCPKFLPPGWWAPSTPGCSATGSGVAAGQARYVLALLSLDKEPFIYEARMHMYISVARLCTHSVSVRVGKSPCWETGSCQTPSEFWNWPHYPPNSSLAGSEASVVTLMDTSRVMRVLPVKSWPCQGQLGLKESRIPPRSLRFVGGLCIEKRCTSKDRRCDTWSLFASHKTVACSLSPLWTLTALEVTVL